LIPQSDIILQQALYGWEELPNPSFPIIFHGIEGREEREKKSPSWFNVHEAKIVVNYIDKLRESRKFRINFRDIGVISPYRKQVSKLKILFKAKNFDGIKVGSVEEFQGQEKKIIIISTVRSLSLAGAEKDIQNNLGFLENPKRFNVAITRAQSLLIIVGNPNLLLHDPNWRTFLKYCQENNAFKGVRPQKIPDDDSIQLINSESEILNKIAELSLNDDNLAVNMENEWRGDDARV